MTNKPVAVPAPMDAAFAEVVKLIHASRQQALRAVNTELIDLYWRIGEYLHHKIEADGWAKGTVMQLAGYIAQREPGLRGFSPQNLWRMRQFFETYRDDSKLSPLVRVLLAQAPPARRLPDGSVAPTRACPSAAARPCEGRTRAPRHASTGPG